MKNRKNKPDREETLCMTTRRDGRDIKSCSALAEDLSSLPSTYNSKFTTPTVVDPRSMTFAGTYSSVHVYI